MLFGSPIFKIKAEKINILELLVKTQLASSKSEAKRMVLQGGVNIKVRGKKIKIEDWRENISLKKEMIIQVGKRKFAKII